MAIFNSYVKLPEGSWEVSFMCFFFNTQWTEIKDDLHGRYIPT